MAGQAGDPPAPQEFNHFEWIVDNATLEPLLRELAAPARAAGRPASVVVPGAGSSRLEDLSAAEFCPVVGVDIDAGALREAARRTRGRPHVRWVQWDLAVEGRLSEQPEVRPEDHCCGSSSSSTGHPFQFQAPARLSAAESAGRAAMPEQFDVVLDKGTFDFLVCEEPDRCCRYVRNLVAMMGGHGSLGKASAYVLVSFRARSMLEGAMGAFGLELSSEPQDLSHLDQASSAAYTFRLAPAGATPADPCQQEAELRRVLDRFFQEEHAMLTPQLAASIAAAPDECTLHEAFELVVPAALRAEYDFELFREDLVAVCPAAAERGWMSRKEMAAFVEENQ